MNPDNPLLINFKYYVDPNGTLFAFAADGSEDAFIGENLTPAPQEKVIETVAPPFSLDLAIDRLIGTVEHIYSDHMRTLNAGYPSVERETWPLQVSEAKDLLTNGESAVTPFIDAMVPGREITRLEMATKIIEKDTAYRTQAGKITGVKQEHVRAIESIALLTKKSAEAACKSYDVSSNWPDDIAGE